MKILPSDRHRALPPNPLTVDTPCCHCGREPSHPQIHYRFAYAAYCLGASSLTTAQRTYVSALCAPCADAERGAGAKRARNGFLGRVQQWSALPINRDKIVRIAEYPDGDPDDERVGDGCFCGGTLQSFRALDPDGDGA